MACILLWSSAVKEMIFTDQEFRQWPKVFSSDNICQGSHGLFQSLLCWEEDQAEKIIAEEQAGFRPGRSTTEQILNLCILCEKYLQHQQIYPRSLQKFLICATKGENWERKDLSLKYLRNTRKWTTTSRGARKRLKKTWQENNVVRLKKIWGRTTVRGHTNWWKTWPLWNRGKRLLSKIVQENASQKSDRYWADGQNTALSTRPVEIHQYWTVPMQTQRMTTPSFRKKWRLLKQRKSAVVDNIPAELVQAGREAVITAIMTICNKTWMTGE